VNYSAQTPVTYLDDGMTIRFFETVLQEKYLHTLQDSYNCVELVSDQYADLLLAHHIRAGSSETILVGNDHALALIYRGAGSVTIKVAGDSRKTVNELFEISKLTAPKEPIPEDDTIYVTFWAHGAGGPTSNRRKLDVPTWEDINLNYNRKTVEKIVTYMNSDWRPERSGQIILWHGEPGTGKTTALRAMAKDWRKWCEIHYIVDPEKFFGSHADYMMSVMTTPSDSWRLLVLEDTGEFLTADAKMHTGSQGLSRFLNAMDGLLGQGLNFTCLVTTNEEIRKLHPAVTRAGRCASIVEFEALTSEEVLLWAEYNEIDPKLLQGAMPLADLFSLAKNIQIPNKRKLQSVGFTA
jgi:hypothetical protein